MELREFRTEDAARICKWLRTEDELYRWSADRFNKYPLSANDIVENNSILKDLLQKDENPIDLLLYLGYIFVDEGMDKTLMYCSKSLNPKTEERLKRLKKKMNKHPNCLIMDIYISLSEEEKNRCNDVLKKYKELVSNEKEHSV